MQPPETSIMFYTQHADIKVTQNTSNIHNVYIHKLSRIINKTLRIRSPSPLPPHTNILSSPSLTSPTHLVVVCKRLHGFVSCTSMTYPYVVYGQKRYICIKILLV